MHWGWGRGEDGNGEREPQSPWAVAWVNFQMFFFGEKGRAGFLWFPVLVTF